MMSECLETECPVLAFETEVSVSKFKKSQTRKEKRARLMLELFS